MTSSPLNLVFAKERSFSKKLNAAFAFVGHNARTLIPNLIMIPGPFSLLAGIGYGLYNTHIFSSAFANPSANPFENNNGILLAIALLLMAVGGILSFALGATTIFLHIEAHITTGSAMVPLKEMWQRAWSSFGRMLGFSFLYMLSLMLVFTLGALPIGLISAAAPALGAFLIFFGFIIIFIFFLSTIVGYPIYWFERTGVLRTLTRLIQLHTEWRWFSSAGLILVLFFLGGTMSSLFAIPTYGLIFYKAFHVVQNPELAASSPAWYTYAMILASIIMFLGQMASYSIIYLGATLQYFNLVEKREARGLLERIDEFGKQPA